MANKNKPDRDTLYRLYVDEHKTLQEIADIYDVTVSTSHNWLKRVDIPRRSRKEQAVIKDRSHWCPEEHLRQMYYVDKKSLKEIADMYGVARGTVGNWAKCYGMNIRSGSEAMLKSEVKPTKDVLYGLYIDREKTTCEIAAMFGVHKTTVSNWLHSYSIDTRIGGEQYIYLTHPSDDELYEMYVVNAMTLSEIANVCGTENVSTVGAWLAKANISARTYSEIGLKGKQRPTDDELRIMYIEDGLSAKQIGDAIGVNDATVGSWLRRADIPLRSMSEIKLCGKHRPADDELYDIYVTEQKSSVEIGNMFGVCPSTVSRWLVASGVDMRTNSEAHTGELSNAWLGGISFEPYCPKFNESFKETVREKYNRTCFLCGITEEEQIKRQNAECKRPFKLAVHHVSYDHNCLCDGIICEFVPLCIKCHGRTNTNRWFWERLFIYALGYQEDYYTASSMLLPVIDKNDVAVELV